MGLSFYFNGNAEETNHINRSQSLQLSACEGKGMETERERTAVGVIHLSKTRRLAQFLGTLQDGLHRSTYLIGRIVLFQQQ